MIDLVSKMAPELFLITVACFLFLLGVSSKAAARHAAAWVAFAALAAVFFYELAAVQSVQKAGFDFTRAFTHNSLSEYIRLIASGMGVLLVLLAWPTNRHGTGSDSIEYGYDAGEFFALMLLSITGILLAAGANDMILLFLGIELASIPTYIMVSISRPLPAAQEAGIKYFFLGTMAAAVMLFGFSYLYGTTGYTQLDRISALLHPATGDQYAPAVGKHWLTTWQTLAVVMLLGGLSFKIAAVPLHAYAGDVYQGAATPVTAFLAFVPKTTGFVAILKLLLAVGGPHYLLDPVIIKLLWALALATMCVGNVLALIPFNVKRVLAYSSVAHSGYMLVGVTALATAAQYLPHGTLAEQQKLADVQAFAIAGVLFYLAGYGVMNSGAFGVLMLLPSREAADAFHAHSEAAKIGAKATVTHVPATTAETFDDLAGQGRRHIAAGLAMSICCFSLIGIPLTVGFVGKFYLIQPALETGLFWLAIFVVVNALVSAGYYLKIVAAMFLRPAPEVENATPTAVPVEHKPMGHARHHFAPHGLAALAHAPMPLVAAVLLSVICTLLFGMFLPALSGLTDNAQRAAGIIKAADFQNPEAVAAK